MKKILTVLATIFIILSLVSGCSKDENNDPVVSSDLFEGSFDTLPSYATTVTLSYQRKDGSTANSLLFPKQVVILAASGAGLSDIQNLVKQNQGQLISAIPNARLYLAVVPVINTFLTAMYHSNLVWDAFPNAAIGSGAGGPGGKSVSGDKNSIVQTLDLSTNMGCDMQHKDAVGKVAESQGVSVKVNDITTYAAGTDSARGATHIQMRKLLDLLNYAHQNNLPVVINMSTGGMFNDRIEDYCYRLRFLYMLEAVEKQNPALLDNAVIIMSCTDAPYNEKGMLDSLHHDFNGSPVWDHLYFAGSQEGSSGCGMGYANPGTVSYLAAPACDISIPGSNCVVTGNSFSTPAISGVIADTYELLRAAGQQVQLPYVADALWAYQKDHNGKLPTSQQLFNFIMGITPTNSYGGNWSGIFYYKAAIPQTSGPPKIVNTSFNLEITLEPIAEFPGVNHVLKVTYAKCSDPTFGAVSGVVPVGNLSMAMLPANYGTVGESGMGLSITFPNGSIIMTTNSAGALVVSSDGTVVSNTASVVNNAFHATGTVDNSNEPGSGPGGYAYNWCTFKSWSISR